MSALEPEVRQYFHAHGLQPKSPETLNESLRLVIEQMDRTLRGSSKGELTAAEIEMLEKAGMDLEEHPDDSDPVLDYATEYAAILSTSETPTDVAETMNVTPVRVRQLIREHSMYAIRIDGRWHVPTYQFDTHGRLVKNIGLLNQELHELDPVSVVRWFTYVDPELEGRDGKAMSPLSWLHSGRSPKKLLSILPRR